MIHFMCMSGSFSLQMMRLYGTAFEITIELRVMSLPFDYVKTIMFTKPFTMLKGKRYKVMV